MSVFAFAALTCAAAIIEIIFTPLFLKAQRPGISSRSRLYKMICASMFVLIGFLAYFYSGNGSRFAVFMLIGLCSSWFGDLFLHIKGKKFFAVGFVFFLAAHLLYLTAYKAANEHYFPERSFFKAFEIILCAAVLLCVMLYYALKKKMKLTSAPMLACSVYGVILVAMLVKATVFSAEWMLSGANGSAAGGALLIFGGICFFMSDISLAILLFSEKDKKRIGLKNHNIATYFAAQTALALSILFVCN